MDSISVDCRSRNYDVVVGRGLDDLLFEVVGDRKALVITDVEIYGLYKEKIKNALPHAEVYTIRSGERSKCENVLFDIIEYMLDNEFDRRTIIIAFGGGVIGDIAGFVASIYLRGIDYVQVPTTLLAQVDSAIGGKVGINVDNVKNAVGMFYQPKQVIVDTDFLQTLDEREILSGIGEIVKTACLDEKLFNYVEKHLSDIKQLKNEIIIEVIERCVEIKADIVSLDEKETMSIRSRLNLGHTIGQALEVSARFLPKSHGEYILNGIYLEAEISSKLGRIDPIYKTRLQTLILGIITEAPEISSVEKLVQNAMRDKKNRNGLISLIVPVDVGDVDEVVLEGEELERLLEEIEQA